MAFNMVQSMSAEVNSVELLEQYLRLVLATALESDEEIVVKVVDRSTPEGRCALPSAVSDEKAHFPVILISGWYAPKQGEEGSYFNGWRPWTTFRGDGATSSVDAAIAHVLGLFREHGRRWADEFRQKLGDGYTQSFLPDDGSVKVGYGIRFGGSFPGVVGITLVHIYYGK